MIVFAHYWGIDEVGVFVLPALAGLLALRWAEKRARRQSGPDVSDSGDQDDPDAD